MEGCGCPWGGDLDGWGWVEETEANTFVHRILNHYPFEKKFSCF